MDITTFNFLEALLWLIFSVILFIKSRSQKIKMLNSLAFFAGVVFFVFALSDVIEEYTGAWWRPWWLLVVKGLCTIALLWCWLAYKKTIMQKKPEC